MGDLTKNFSRHEFACHCGCGFTEPDAELVSILQLVRDTFAAPVTVTSGCRCSKHNQAVGGATNSYHLHGQAADIIVADTHPQAVYNFLDHRFPGRLGLKVYSNPWRIHIDTRQRRWRNA